MRLDKVGDSVKELIRRDATGSNSRIKPISCILTADDICILFTARYEPTPRISSIFVGGNLYLWGGYADTDDSSDKRQKTRTSGCNFRILIKIRSVYSLQLMY